MEMARTLTGIKCALRARGSSLYYRNYHRRVLGGLPFDLGRTDGLGEAPDRRDSEPPTVVSEEDFTVAHGAVLTVG